MCDILSPTHDVSILSDNNDHSVLSDCTVIHVDSSSSPRTSSLNVPTFATDKHNEQAAEEGLENASPNTLTVAAAVTATTPHKSSSLGSTSAAVKRSQESLRYVMQEIRTARGPTDGGEIEDVEESEASEDAQAEEEEGRRRREAFARRAALAQAEQAEHLDMRVKELERMLSYVQKNHAKQLRIKDDEIEDLRTKSQRSKDQEDATKAEARRELAQKEAEYNSKEEALMTKLERAKIANGQGNPYQSGKGSFSMRFASFSRSSNTAIANKVHANQTEREHAKVIAHLEDTCQKEKAKAELYKNKFQEYQEQATFHQNKCSELLAELATMRKLQSRIIAKARRIQNDKKMLEQEKEDLVLKAGWAAEQIQELTGELEYERSKHIKVSRLQGVKQAEELARLKKENDDMRKNTPVKDEKAKPKVPKPSSLAIPSVSANNVILSTAQVLLEEEEAACATFGARTIQELIVMKAQQRDERIKKNETRMIKRMSKDLRKKDCGNDLVKTIGQKMDGIRKSVVGTEEDFEIDSSDDEEFEDWR